MKKILMFGLVLLMSISFVVAQIPKEDLVISSGETIIEDWLEETTELSGVLGAVISSINILNREVILFLGQEIYVSETGGSFSDFDLYAFKTGTVVDFETLTFEDPFEVSEVVDIRGINSSWTTINIKTTIEEGEYLADPTKINIPILFDDGMVVTPRGALSFWCDGVQETAITRDCISYDCPTDEELIFTGQRVGIIQIANQIGLYEVCGKRVFSFNNQVSLQYWVGDEDGNELFEFSLFDNSGYAVTSNLGQSLMILPSDVGNMDLYAHII